MFKNVLKGIGLVGIGYLIYKTGYTIGLKKCDKELQDLEKKMLNKDISASEYLERVNKRINEIEGRC